MVKIVYLGLMIHPQRHTNVYDALRLMGRNFLHLTLIHSYCTKYNETNIDYSDVQKHVSNAE